MGKKDGPGSYTYSNGKIINGAWKNDSLYLNYDEVVVENSPKGKDNKIENCQAGEDWQKKIR